VNSKQSRRCVVIGGGIAGAFTAHFLAGRGFAVTIVERGEIAGEASGFNPGGINPLHGAAIPGAMQPLAWKAYQLHRNLWDDLRTCSGISFTARKCTRIHLALDETDLERLERAKELHCASPGIPAHWIERDQMLAREPRLNPAMIRALWTEGNARVDSAPLTRAVVQSALERGASLMRDEVLGIERSGDRASRVLTASSALDCEAVVVATGPWVAGPSEWLGVPLPVEPVKGDLLLAEIDGVAHSYTWRDGAVYGDGSDRAWLGGTEECAGFDRAPSEEARRLILERASQVFPELVEARIVQQTSALRPVTPDGIPIVGRAPGWENAFLALGGGRKGMLFGPVMGAAVADLIANGQTALPIEPCNPERFTHVASK
jgi:glycine oxidase